MDPGRRRDRAAPCAPAIDRAERPAESIGYVNYHGTSTQLERRASKVACVKRVFGSHAGRLPDRRPSP
jgi:3-oxoacyl-(acyl-carrier-protein) synthase